MNNLQLRQIFLEIQTNLRCMQCGKMYRTENIHLRGSFKNMYLFQLTCDDHSALATITVVGQQTTVDVKPLTANDVLKFHQELSTFNGDFATRFRNTSS